MASSPTDIVLLAHDRLGHLVRTVESIEANTPEAHRLTIVDNASEPPVRNWLSENGHRFHQVILLARNEGLVGLDHGVRATSSDPLVVSDADLLLPAIEPSWLARLLGAMERHPDFGMIGACLDPGNRTPTLQPHQIVSALDPDRVEGRNQISEDLVEGDVGVWFQMLRRDALRISYLSDRVVREDMRARGHRVGWCPQVRAVHLGWDDHRIYPGYLMAKEMTQKGWSRYAEVQLLGRPPRLVELARAAPVLAQVEAAGLPADSILELTWQEPCLGAVIEGAVTLTEPEQGALPAPGGGAGAVVLDAPPPERIGELLDEAARVATGMIVLITTLESVGGRGAADLAPQGWRGREARAGGDSVREMARMMDARQGPAARYRVLEQRRQWLEFFSRGTLGAAACRLFVFEPERGTGSAPHRVLLQPGTPVWSVPRTPAPSRPVSSRERVARARVRLGRGWPLRRP